MALRLTATVGIINGRRYAIRRHRHNEMAALPSMRPTNAINNDVRS